VNLETLNKRNTETVNQFIQDFTSKYYDMQKRIQLLQESVSSLSSRVSQLEVDIALLKAKSTGRGPTVNE
jgi:peptidoglycan hydrolase CwlO-like protein